MQFMQLSRFISRIGLRAVTRGFATTSATKSVVPKYTHIYICPSRYMKYIVAGSIFAGISGLYYGYWYVRESLTEIDMSIFELRQYKKLDYMLTIKKQLFDVYYVNDNTSKKQWAIFALMRDTSNALMEHGDEHMFEIYQHRFSDYMSAYIDKYGDEIFMKMANKQGNNIIQQYMKYNDKDVATYVNRRLSHVLDMCMKHENWELFSVIWDKYNIGAKSFYISCYEPTDVRVKIAEHILKNSGDNVSFNGMLCDPVYYDVVKKHNKLPHVKDIWSAIQLVINNARRKNGITAIAPFIQDLAQSRPTDKAVIINSVMVNTQYYDNACMITLLDAIPGDFKGLNFQDVFQGSDLYYEAPELWNYLIKRGVDVNAVFADGTNIWYYIETLKSYRKCMDMKRIA
ncbi:MAG: hypothetical protein Faunusvirus60_1, partial [Faunusvirus sp.]